MRRAGGGPGARLSGDRFGTVTKSEQSYALKEVKLLRPTVPTQVLAMAGDSRSHLGDETIPPRFRIPQPFFKSPSCLIASGEAILIPKDSPGPVHLEGELVIVIDKKACEVPRERGRRTTSTA